MIMLAEMIVGLSCGLTVAGGVFAVVVIVGLVPRMAQMSGGSKSIMLFENCIAGGITTGAWHLLFPLNLSFIGLLGDVIVGAFWGMFVGCLAVAIAEVLDVIPILCRRSKMTRYLPWLLLSISLGKTAGTFLYFLWPSMAQYH